MTKSERTARLAIATLLEEQLGDFEGPTPLELIEKAEGLLGVSFPPGYRAFLASLGVGHVNGYEFYGVFGERIEEGPVPNVVWYTRELRTDGLPNHFVPVYGVGNGEVYVLDCSDEEEQLWTWMPGASPVQVGQTFGELVLEALGEHAV